MFENIIRKYTMEIPICCSACMYISVSGKIPHNNGLNHLLFWWLALDSAKAVKKCFYHYANLHEGLNWWLKENFQKQYSLKNCKATSSNYYHLLSFTLIYSCIHTVVFTVATLLWYYVDSLPIINRLLVKSTTTFGLNCGQDW